MKNPVVIKRNKYGIVVILNKEMSFEELLEAVKDKFKEAEVIAQDDELAVVVDAPSECAINDSIKFIEDNNYCEDASKILKLS